MSIISKVINVITISFEVKKKIFFLKQSYVFYKILMDHNLFEIFFKYLVNFCFALIL